jgi:hypothetical protein
MKIIEVTYGETFNLGNYQSKRVDLKASLDEIEDFREVYEELQKKVRFLGLRKD